jgi:hypothetical protein
MTSQWPIGDDGDYSDIEWSCYCSCGQCGPLNLHDCDTPACNSGQYISKPPDR